MSANGELSALARPLDGLYVLVIEDFEDARTLSTLLLTMNGAQVVAADTVAEALEALERTRFDVVASDVNMPDADGYEFIRRLRALDDEQGGRTPAVAVTAQDAATDRDALRAAGFDEYLAKHVDSSDLVAVVRRLAGREEQEQAGRAIATSSPDRKRVDVEATGYAVPTLGLTPKPLRQWSASSCVGGRRAACSCA